MKNALLVLNAGSSSIKFQVFLQEDLVAIYSGVAERLKEDGPFVKIENETTGDVILKEDLPEDSGHDVALNKIIETLSEHLKKDDTKLVYAGHRVVHGGSNFANPVVIDEQTIKDLEELTPLAPLHQPHNVVGMKYILANYPEIKQVACFDTAFHTTNSESIQTYALPRKYWDMGIKRYGFHGLSYDYIASKLPEVNADAKKTIVCHIGNGASMCAIADGKSVAHSLGFTAVDGLPMGTRTGNIDPGVILHMITALKMSAKEIETVIYKESGMLGLSGISNDLRDIEGSNDKMAKLALEYYTMSIARKVGDLATAMGGVDSIVFTAGVGEKSPLVRQMVCEKLEWLGVEIDLAENDYRGKLKQISTDSSSLDVYVIPTNEELMIAKYTCELLN
ncbi:MAG: acetate/propionate family kinase [Alphaproteobacteria bacterium]|nr:acetate/propionate family kinase [Alphaproteobacteria bacterium]